MCRRVTYVSRRMKEMLGEIEMVGSVLPVPSGFGRLVAWYDGPCVDCGVLEWSVQNAEKRFFNMDAVQNIISVLVTVRIGNWFGWLNELLWKTNDTSCTHDTHDTRTCEPFKIDSECVYRNAVCHLSLWLRKCRWSRMNCCLCSAPMTVFVDFHVVTGEPAELHRCPYPECGSVVVLIWTTMYKKWSCLIKL